MFKREFIVIFALLMSVTGCFAGNGNNLKTLFQNSESNICAINIRTFNAKDLNNNGIIDNREESGNFINAIERLDEMKSLGINTLHLLPITPTGKLKAIGTAGSLYAVSDLNSINPQLADKNSNLKLTEQVKLFVDECHKRGIKVIADLPSCGAYDMFLTNPELFLKDEKQCSVVPSDWTDVRLFNTGKNDELNPDLMSIHKKFVDMIIELGFDGIRADVATIKPAKFWQELITYTKEKDSEFMFLAEASDSWREPPSKFAEFTPYDKLLESGFDGYYGSFFNLKDWNAEQFIEHIKFNKKLLSSFPENKNVILSFTTHDELSPIILHGENFSVMISWLYATLPFNPYCIDGFFTGDHYIYPWENKKAETTYTDDDSYFVHSGKMDIFNFSRKPDGKNKFINDNFKRAMKFRQDNLNLITKGNFIPLKTDNNRVFAFERVLNNNIVIVIGNLDFRNDTDKIVIKTSGIKNKTYFDIINQEGYIRIKHNRMEIPLKAGEIKVLRIGKAN